MNECMMSALAHIFAMEKKVMMDDCLYWQYHPSIN
jgi:hypothetical protein